jgi:hypothetical protein
MLDLEHLDALDDDAPPDDDLSGVRQRVGRMRARRRWTAIAAGAVVLAGAVATALAVGQDDHRVRVAGPSTPDGITARLVVPQKSYPAGYSLEGTIVFVNGTGHGVDYRVGCPTDWDVDLSKDGVVYTPTMPATCGPLVRTQHLAPGETRLPFYVGLGYPQCVDRDPTPSAPLCTGDPPGIPDLPPGRYQLVFRGTTSPFDAMNVAPLDITVTAHGDASAPLPDTLPKIGADNAAAAQDEFAGLYGMEFALYRDRLRALGVDVVDYGTSGGRLLIHIKPSADASAERDVILSLFAHPEIVTVEPA